MDSPWALRVELPDKIHSILYIYIAFPMQYLGQTKNCFICLILKSECPEFLSAKYANPNLERG